MSREIGTLVVVVLKARNLRDKHTIHKQDVFAQATLNKTTKMTKTDVRGGQHPVWDEELRFPVVKAISDETRKIEVACYAKEPRYDDLIGSGSVDISETLKTGEFDDWVPLKTEDGGYRGDLFLEMTYYSAAPPPQRRPSKWKPSDRLKRPSSVYTYSLEAGAIPNDHTTPVPNGANKHDVLPPLPEEPVSAPFIPASLRPGGAGSAKASPKAGSGLLPPEHPMHTQAPLRDSSPPAPTPRIDYIPPTLRPGAGASLPVPVHSPTLPSPQPPQTHLRDSSPNRDPLPPNLYSGVGPPEHYPTLPAQPLQPPSPTRDSLPPYLRPGGGGPQPSVPVPLIPEPQIPVPDITYNSAPPRPYSEYNAPSRRPYSEYGPSPHASFGEYGSSPTPRPSYGEYGSPPRGYNTAPPPMYPSQPQVPAQPQPQPYPPYGYGYPSTNAPPPPQRDLDLPDPYLQARYQSPLPLPDEARVGRTPTPSHPFSQALPQPQVHTQPHPQSQPQLQSQSPPKEARAAAPAKTPAQPKGPSREERDRQLALELEKEEAERRRIVREQEERDMELARQLDLELNLDGEAGSTSAAAAGSVASESRLNAGVASTAGMPGGW